MENNPNRSNIDPELITRLNELKKEEARLDILKAEKEKYEDFLFELKRKSAYIAELEAKIKQMESEHLNFSQYNSEIEYLTQALESSEKENSKLRLAINSQIEEFESSMKDLKHVIQEERVRNKAEVEILQKELITKDDDLEELIEAYEGTKERLANIEKKYENEISNLSKKGKGLADQLKISKEVEFGLREENEGLRQECFKLKENLNACQEKIRKVDDYAEEMIGVKLALAEEKRKQKDVNKKYIEAAEKYESLKKSIDKEFDGLKEELDQAVEIIKRQENSLQDLRSAKQEGDKKVLAVMNELSIRDAEIVRLSKISKKIEEKNESLIEKNEELERRLAKTMNENSELREVLEQARVKQEKDRNDRKLFTKKKLDILLQRNEEMSKLSDACNSFELGPS
jgi:chromosome segregation ATPase